MPQNSSPPRRAEAKNNKMQDLATLRRNIDSIDDDILRLIARRGDVVRAIGNIKSTNGLPVVQPTRFKEVVRRLEDNGLRMGVSADCVRKVWTALHDEAVSKQQS